MWDSIVLRWQSLTKGQQILLVVFSIAGVLTFGLSLYRISYTIRSPFLTDKQAIYSAKELIGLTPAEETAKQKRLDTDGDGLSDWDEENTYHTNPNSRDSCGDGMPDNVRVATGKNLVCGQLGNLDYSGVAGGSSSAFDGLPQTAQPTDQGSQDAAFLMHVATSGTSAMGVDSSGAATTLPRDPVMIRQLLKGQVSDAELNALSDDDLLKLYDDAMAKIKNNGQTENAGGTSSTPAVQNNNQ